MPAEAATNLPRRITLQEAVDIVGAPPPVVATKIRPQLDDDHLTFIANSPLLFLATSDATGELDCSPRGDPPGFVRVLDDHLLAIPDRPGNRLAQSMRNIAEHPDVGLLFAIPGIQVVAHAAAANTGTADLDPAELDVAVAAAYRELY